MLGNEKRIDEINSEIRYYPAPIARCDEQLTALLDERRRLMDALTDTEQRGGCSPAAIWINDGGFHAA
jgi:chorismate mutase